MRMAELLLAPARAGRHVEVAAPVLVPAAGAGLWSGRWPGLWSGLAARASESGSGVRENVARNHASSTKTLGT